LRSCGPGHWRRRMKRRKRIGSSREKRWWWRRRTDRYSTKVDFVPMTKPTMLLKLAKLRGPLEKFVDWRQCAAVMLLCLPLRDEDYATTTLSPPTTTWHNSHRLLLLNSGVLPPVHELYKRPSYMNRP
jgi:hypothetical protein